MKHLDFDHDYVFDADDIDEWALYHVLITTYNHLDERQKKAAIYKKQNKDKNFKEYMISDPKDNPNREKKLN